MLFALSWLRLSHHFCKRCTYEVTVSPSTFTIVIDQGTFDKIKALGLPEKRENNKYLLIHKHGDGDKAPSNWNVKVFTNSKKG